MRGSIHDIKNLKSFRYYSVPFDGQYLNHVSEEELILKLENYLLKAIKRQMLSDVPLGFFIGRVRF